MRKLAKYSAVAATGLVSLAVSASSVMAASDDTIGAGITGVMCICYAVGGIVGIGLLILNIMMILDVNKRDEKVLPKKQTWFILLIVGLFVGFGPIVSIYYFFARKKKMDAMAK